MPGSSGAFPQLRGNQRPQAAARSIPTHAGTGAFPWPSTGPSPPLCGKPRGQSVTAVHPRIAGSEPTKSEQSGPSPRCVGISQASLFAGGPSPQCGKVTFCPVVRSIPALCGKQDSVRAARRSIPATRFIPTLWETDAGDDGVQFIPANCAGFVIAPATTIRSRMTCRHRCRPPWLHGTYQHR